MYDSQHHYFIPYELILHFHLAIVGITAFIFAISGILYVLKADLGGVLELNFRTPLRVFGILTAICAGLFWFVCYFGNRQFGAYDNGVMLDAGWRLMNGQRPYTDFFCTLPPAFILGVKYAFALWGPFWNSQLYLTATYTCVTFVWLYLLLDQLLEVRAAAVLTALAIECTSNLVTAFWWYNPTASVAGAIFLFSCLLYWSRPRVVSYQISYVMSLLLLGLMKPNTAAPLIAAFVLILLSGKHYARTIVLTALAGLAAIAFLAMNHVSPILLIESYRAAASKRGLSLFGIRNDSTANLLITAMFVCWLLTPFWLWLISVKSFLLNRQYFALRFYLMLAIAPLIAFYAMTTNGESKFVDIVLVMSPGVILIFGRPEYVSVWVGPSSAILQRFYAAVLLAIAVIGVYTGVIRMRVATTAAYFQIPDGQRTGNAFFADLRTGTELVNVLREVQDVLNSKPKGPIFFGPRMEFGYAAFRVPSPKYLPIWWHPGTSFPLSEQSHILHEWQSRRFGTLIFGRDGFTFYGPDFLEALDRMYVRDEKYPEITVFHLK